MISDGSWDGWISIKLFFKTLTSGELRTKSPLIIHETGYLTGDPYIMVYEMIAT